MAPPSSQQLPKASMINKKPWQTIGGLRDGTRMHCSIPYKSAESLGSRLTGQRLDPSGHSPVSSILPTKEAPLTLERCRLGASEEEPYTLNSEGGTLRFGTLDV